MVHVYGVIPRLRNLLFVFSDYMKPAIRMAALMELPVASSGATMHSAKVEKTLSHPEPVVEQEAQIRLMEKLNPTITDYNGMLVLRPPTYRKRPLPGRYIWNTATPTGLILSRQRQRPSCCKLSALPKRFRQKREFALLEADANADVVLLASALKYLPLCCAGSTCSWWYQGKHRICSFRRTVPQSPKAYQ